MNGIRAKLITWVKQLRFGVPPFQHLTIFKVTIIG
jgi:hypothetical protein